MVGVTVIDVLDGVGIPNLNANLFEAVDPWRRGAFVDRATTNEFGDAAFFVDSSFRGCIIVVVPAPPGGRFKSGGAWF